MTGVNAIRDSVSMLASVQIMPDFLAQSPEN